MCGGPSVAPQRLVACQASLLATGKRVEEEPGWVEALRLYLVVRFVI